MRIKTSPIRLNCERFYNIWGDILPIEFDVKEIATFVGHTGLYYKLFTDKVFKIKLTDKRFSEIVNGEILIPADVFAPYDDLMDEDKVAYSVTAANHYQTKEILKYKEWKGNKDYNPFIWDVVKNVIFEDIPNFADSLELRMIYELCVEIYNKNHNESNKYYRYFSGMYNSYVYEDKFAKHLLETYEIEPTLQNGVYALIGYLSQHYGYGSEIGEILKVEDVVTRLNNKLSHPDFCAVVREIFERLYQEDDRDEEEKDQSMQPLEGNEGVVGVPEAILIIIIETFNDNIEMTDEIEMPTSQEVLVEEYDEDAIKINDIMSLYKKGEELPHIHDAKRQEFKNLANDLKTIKRKLPIKFQIEQDGQELNEDDLYVYKIFPSDLIGNNNKLHKKKTDPETIILVDVSGSTEKNYEFKHYLKHEMLEVCQSGFNSMKKAQMPCLMLAHTEYGRTECNIFAIASNRMRFIRKPNYSTTYNQARFCVAHNKIASSGNFDGNALKWAASNFSSTAKAKVLIHLSDGQPAGKPTGYTKSAEDHVMETVEKLRKQGIIVISFSMTKGVVENNNRIYGEDYNFSCWEKGALSKQMKRVIRTVAQAFHS